MKILVTGSKGYIAKKIIGSLPPSEVEGISRDNFNLLDKNKTDNFFKDKKYDVVIHTAIQGGTRLKSEDQETFFNNLKMFYNLLDNKKSFKKFISLGSGAEIYNPDSFYGFSKKIINDIILNNDNFFNLRIYGIFDHDEWNSRFIKSNILRYINKEKIIIHQDKFMDFFYMHDFLVIIKNIIYNNYKNKIEECCYEQKYKLSDIANIINTLGNYKVDIEIQNEGYGLSYIGKGNRVFRGSGIQKGIEKTYKELLKSKGNIL
jgi:nucleoside-diphosphate-sugar epimerase